MSLSWVIVKTVFPESFLEIILDNCLEHYFGENLALGIYLMKTHIWDIKQQIRPVQKKQKTVANRININKV